MNLALMAGSLLLVFVIVEIGLRYYVYRTDERYFAERDETRKQIRATQAKSDSIIALDPDPKIMFTLKPKITFTFAGAEVRTNKEGFRDIDHEVAKPAGTVRILGIGDSVMFAQGVAQGQGYMQQLERELSRLYPSRRWEAITMASSDYNTVMEVQTLKTKGLKYNPDVIVLGFISNDTQMPWGTRTRDDYFALDRLFIVSFIRYRLDPNSGAFTSAGVDSALAGKGAVDSAFRDLRDMARKRGIEVFAVFFEPGEDAIKSWGMERASAMGFHVLDIAPAIKTYMKTNNISTYLHSPLSVYDGHPSLLGHTIAAETLKNALIESGTIDRLTK